MISKREQLWRSLADKEFRRQLIDEHINVGLAFQIRALRNRQKLTQAELAKLTGDKNKQPMISEWEDPNYGKYTLATLKELAKAFDVGLLVRFVPFSKLVDWTVDLSKDAIAPPSFGEERDYRATVTWADTSLDANSSIYSESKVVPVSASDTERRHEVRQPNEDDGNLPRRRILHQAS